MVPHPAGWHVETWRGHRHRPLEFAQLALEGGRRTGSTWSAPSNYYIFPWLEATCTYGRSAIDRCRSHFLGSMAGCSPNRSSWTEKTVCDDNRHSRKPLAGECWSCASEDDETGYAMPSRVDLLHASTPISSRSLELLLFPSQRPGGAVAGFNCRCWRMLRKYEEERTAPACGTLRGSSITRAAHRVVLTRVAEPLVHHDQPAVWSMAG